MEHNNMLDQILTKDQAHRLRNILGNTSVGALPHGGTGYGIQPDTMDHLLDVMDSLSTAVAEMIRRTEIAEANLTGIKLDLRAAGRVFELMRERPDGLPDANSEKVHHAKAEELINFIGYTTDWLGNRWRVHNLLPGEGRDEVKIELTRMRGAVPLFDEVTVTRNAPVSIYPPEG